MILDGPPAGNSRAFDKDPLAERIVIEKRADAVGQRPRVARANQDAVDAVANHAGNAPDGGGHGRQGKDPRFTYAAWNALRDRRDDVNIGPSIVGKERLTERHPPQEPHAVGQSIVGCFRTQAVGERRFRCRADQIKGQVTALADKSGQRIEEYVGAFGGGQGPDVQTQDQVTETETVDTIADAARQLSGFKKPVYVQGADAVATKEALEHYCDTTIGVRNAQGKIVKRSTRGKHKRR